MKGIIPFNSLGRGPAMLINCVLGTFALMLVFRNLSAFLTQNSSAITEIIAGLSIILFSLYDTFIRKEKNTIWGIPAWLFAE